MRDEGKRRTADFASLVPHPTSLPSAHETCTSGGMASKSKVLIVDDNSDVRRLFAIGLNQHGFEVKLAANGAEAVERIQEEQPDVIVLDWLMPLMDGGEVLSRVSTNGIPIIVISGQPAPEDDARDP